MTEQEYESILDAYLKVHRKGIEALLKQEHDLYCTARVDQLMKNHRFKEDIVYPVLIALTGYTLFFYKSMTETALIFMLGIAAGGLFWIRGIVKSQFSSQASIDFINFRRSEIIYNYVRQSEEEVIRSAQSEEEASQTHLFFDIAYRDIHNRSSKNWDLKFW